MFKKSSRNSKGLRWWDLLAALLFLAAMLTSATRLVATDWVTDLGLVQNIVVMAAIIGLALGLSVFPRGVVLFFSLAYGTFVVPWQLGLTISEGIEWKERLISMTGRIQVIVDEIIASKPVTDNLFFLFLMAILFWFLGVYGGYQITRYADAWRAILPTGLVTVVIHSFDPLLARRAWYLAIYIFLALLLVARLNFLRKRQNWQRTRTHIPPDAGFDFSRYMLIISAITVLVAWNIPVLANPLPAIRNMYSVIETPWLSLKDKASFMFASLRASVGLVSDYYGDQLTLGRGSIHTNAVVMTVDAPANPFAGARYYWRARTYDQYQDGQWKTTLIAKQEYSPGDPDLSIPDSKQRVQVEVTYKPFIAISALYMVPQPFWFSRPGTIQYALDPDGSIDLVGMQVHAYIRPGEIYKVRSSISSVTQLELRSAGTDYPEWVLSRYLQLPTQITPRTRELAQQIAEGKTNPYDVAEALTQWLRDNIEYSELIDEPPQNQEPLDWFLFDYKKGFCNYYSSAEVILLRILGIPARWSVGYAQGERITISPGNLPPEVRNQLPEAQVPENDTFRVRQIDAHAWPEVYFPNIGWVEFEPTVNQSPLVRPSGESTSETTSSTDNPTNSGDLQREKPEQEGLTDESLASQQQNLFWRSPWFLVLGIFLTIAGVAVGILGFFARTRPALVLDWWDRIVRGEPVPFPARLERGLKRLGFQVPGFLRRWTEFSLLPALSKAYLEINRALSLLGQKPPIHTTPAERTSRLIEVLPPAREPAELLLAEYQVSVYSPHPADLNAARQASMTIRRLSIMAWFQKILARFREPVRSRPIYRGKHGQ